MYKRKSFHLYWLFWLTLAAVSPYLPLLKGEYLFDDIQVIEANAQLKEVTSFKDCFTFVLKPSKPVTNFLLAIGQWLGNGSIFAPRLLSLLVHVAVVWLLYFNLVQLRQNLNQKLPHRFPFWVALLFAVLPIHSEAMGIVLFRMEMLGALFTLSALLALQVLLRQKSSRFGWISLLFLSQGFASLSKEVFLLVLPVTLGLFLFAAHDSLGLFFVRPSQKPVLPRNLIRWWGMIVVFQAFWAVILGILLQRDHASDYPYADVVGRGVLDGALHLKLSAVALWEGVFKVFTGYDLTIIRLRDRFGGLGTVSEGTAVVLLVLFATLCGLAFLRKSWSALWAGVLFIGIGVYLAIPNINIGSEHYWYFPSIPLLVLLITGFWHFWQRISRRPKRYVSFLVAVYALALLTTLIHRVFTMESRLKFYFAELEKHPESPSIWSDVGMALMEKGPKYLPEAKKLIDRGKALEPLHPNILTAEFLYFFHQNDLEGATKSLKTLVPLFESRPKFLGRFHFHYGLMQERAGRPSEAALAYLKAIKQEPGKVLYREAYEKLAGK